MKLKQATKIEKNKTTTTVQRVNKAHPLSESSALYYVTKIFV